MLPTTNLEGTDLTIYPPWWLQISGQLTPGNTVQIVIEENAPHLNTENSHYNMYNSAVLDI